MALHYDLTRVDHDSDYWRQSQRNDVTEALIFVTMAIDMGELTAESAPEFYARVYAWERGRGFMCQDMADDRERLIDRPITWADVVGHIGLKTNVFPKSSRPAFIAKLARAMREGFLSTPDQRMPAVIRNEIRRLMNDAYAEVIKATTTVR